MGFNLESLVCSSQFKTKFLAFLQKISLCPATCLSPLYLMYIIRLKYKTFYIHVLSGGNQRELARAKNLKKQQEQAKKKGSEGGAALNERKERCAQFCQRIQRRNIISP